MILFLQLASDHSPGFVLTAVAICTVAGWLLATLLQTCETMRGSRRTPWLVGTALIAGLGVWTTHFIAMLGYRPDMALSYDGLTTAASALLAVIVTGGPLAASTCTTSRRQRAMLGALAGFGIGAMHYTGMAGIEGCLSSYSTAATLIAYGIGVAGLAAARGVAVLFRSRLATCALFALAVGGTHFIAIAGTTLTMADASAAAGLDNLVLSIFVAAGAAALFLGALATILTANRFDAQERAHSKILSTVLNNMSNGLIFFDRTGRLTLFNRRYTELFGIDEGSLRAGMSPREVIRVIADRNNWNTDHRALIEERHDRLMASAGLTVIDQAMDDGRIIEVEMRPVQSGGTVFVFDDVTNERRAQQRIEELVFVDPLTKLANRRALQERLERSFESGQRSELLLIDLDRFKAVNDIYGHGVGDDLLVRVAARIVAIVGDGFAARLGGDELAVLVYHDLDDSLLIANRIIDAIAEPFPIGGNTILIGCSIGMCRTDDARDAADLMQRSDVALYESKRNGRGRASCYKPGMLEAVVERQMLETDMRAALERGEFHLAYQPVLALGEDRIIGYEALIRWDHPTLGTISPARFVPLAEETGQIVEIGRWVLQEACREAASWSDGRYVAVNISPVQFRSPLLLSHLTSALAASGLPARRLEVELTETAMMVDGGLVAASLKAMRLLGVKVAMDDFGTGYSSLAHLRDFPLDRIKVDRSFVTTAETDRPSLAVLRGITRIAQDLGVAIQAEGVETEAQLELLRSIGCDAVQGYLIGRPERMTARGGTAAIRLSA